MHFKNLLSFMSMLLIFVLLTPGCKPDGGEDPSDLASLTKLVGDWIRVESNNPIADYVKVKMESDYGTITDKANSNFAVGDIKWRSITPASPNTYSYQELGSDGNYYEATLTLINDNEISMKVNSSGAGNSQKWVRDDGIIGTEDPTILECNHFSQDRILENTPAGVDYIVTCVMDITSNVVIEPGVVIEFEENAGFGVYDGGTFKAIGSDESPIILRGKENIKGYWRGIHIETNSVNNRLEYVEVEDAGGNYVYCCNEPATLFLKDGKAVLKNNTFRNGDGYGLILGTSAEIPDFSSNTITSHSMEPVKLGMKQTAYLDNQSDFTGNDEDYIKVTKQGVNEETLVPRQSVPYLLEGAVIDITKALSIEAGTEMIFEENGGLGIYDEGAIKLDGSSSEIVRLRGKQAVSGYWRGIHIETNSLGNELNYAHISDAGSNYVYCCNVVATVFLKANSRLKMQNTQLSNGKSYGLYAGEDSELRDYQGNTVTSHEETPLYIAAESAGQLDGSGSSYLGNSMDYVGIFNSNVASATTWPKLDVPYLIDAFVVDITEPLTILPGAEVVFNANGGLGIYDNGSINAVGTNEDKIVFRGKSATPGYWRGIHVETNNLDNEFKYARVTDSGGNYVYCCNDKGGLFLKGGIMKVTYSDFRDNSGCGIVIRSGATLDESNNTFFNNADGDICQ